MTEAHTFLLVHGAWHGSWCWQWLSPLLSAAGHQVICPTLPGHGPSGDAGRVRFRDYLDCLQDQLLQARHPVICVGHSMAGMLISALAESRPEEIRQLVYLNAYLPASGDSIFSLMNQDDVDTGDIARHMQLSTNRRSYTLAPEVMSPLFYGHSPGERQAIARQQLCPQPSLPLAQTVALSEAAYGRVPRLALWGRYDRVIPLTLAQWMQARQPSEQRILDTDHSPFASCPEHLVSELLPLARVS